MARKGSPVPGTGLRSLPAKSSALCRGGWAAGRGNPAQFRLHSVLMTILPGDLKRKFPVPLSQKARLDREAASLGSWRGTAGQGSEAGPQLPQGFKPPRAHTQVGGQAATRPKAEVLLSSLSQQPTPQKVSVQFPLYSWPELGVY